MDEGGTEMEREYRKQRKLPGRYVLLVVIIMGNGLLQTVRTEDDMPPWWPAVCAALILWACAWVALSQLRARTRVTADGITRQGPVRARTWAWRDVYDIRVQPVEGGRTALHPQWPAYLYDSDGRRFMLPQLNEWQLDDPFAEVADLRTAAARHRGLTWEQRPEVEERIRRRTVQRKAWRWASIAAALTLGAMVVVLAGEVAVGSPKSPFLLLVCVPLAAFAVLGALLNWFWAVRPPRTP
ncbi:PH domain-containing protein [Streptomyces sp. NPDC086549]|uniref:PH domain-containing protein n=1 Tax=Streptomyces sp. NPDC086549 TaxID=3365752 RepID=UPI0037FE82E1